MFPWGWRVFIGQERGTAKWKMELWGGGKGIWDGWNDKQEFLGNAWVGFNSISEAQERAGNAHLEKGKGQGEALSLFYWGRINQEIAALQAFKAGLNPFKPTPIIQITAGILAWFDFGLWNKKKRGKRSLTKRINQRKNKNISMDQQGGAAPAAPSPLQRFQPGSN